jgi:hypothetical protein
MEVDLIFRLDFYQSPRSVPIRDKHLVGDTPKYPPRETMPQ